MLTLLQQKGHGSHFFPQVLASNSFQSQSPFCSGQSPMSICGLLRRQKHGCPYLLEWCRALLHGVQVLVHSLVLSVGTGKTDLTIYSSFLISFDFLCEVVLLLATQQCWVRTPDCYSNLTVRHDNYTYCSCAPKVLTPVLCCPKALLPPYS
jgi:hypothetical protein